MAESDGERPRARTMVQLDPDNAYARLGVSPLLPTAEIKEVINARRKEVMRRRRTRGEQRFGEEEAEMARLQAIEEEIGTPRARARYDRLNPQNALLTVQPGPDDPCLDPASRAGLALAWIVEELGREAPLPTPECLALWAPRGLDPGLVAFLDGFPTAVGRVAPDDSDAPPGLDALGRIAAAPAPGPSADGSNSTHLTGEPSDG